MKIISKFQDYYDGCIYLCGENVVYNRVMNNRVPNNDRKYHKGIFKSDGNIIELDKIYRDYYRVYIDRNIRTSNYISLSIIILGETIIPFVTIQDGESYSFIYTLKDTKELFEGENSIHSSYRPSIEEHFTKNHIDFYNKVREISKDVIISFSEYRDDWQIPNVINMNTFVTINPKLKNLGLSKFLAPHLCIQEIELYINKINTKDTSVEFSDCVKIQSAGFDKKSFRNKDSI